MVAEKRSYKTTAMEVTRGNLEDLRYTFREALIYEKRDIDENGYDTGKYIGFGLAIYSRGTLARTYDFNVGDFIVYTRSNKIKVITGKKFRDLYKVIEE